MGKTIDLQPIEDNSVELSEDMMNYLGVQDGSTILVVCRDDSIIITNPQMGFRKQIEYVIELADELGVQLSKEVALRNSEFFSTEEIKEILKEDDD